MQKKKQNNFTTPTIAFTTPTPLFEIWWWRETEASTKMGKVREDFKNTKKKTKLEGKLQIFIKQSLINVIPFSRVKERWLTIWWKDDVLLFLGALELCSFWKKIMHEEIILNI